MHFILKNRRKKIRTQKRRLSHTINQPRSKKQCPVTQKRLFVELQTNLTVISFIFHIAIDQQNQIPTTFRDRNKKKEKNIEECIIQEEKFFPAKLTISQPAHRPSLSSGERAPQPLHAASMKRSRGDLSTRDGHCLSPTPHEGIAQRGGQYTY